MKSQPDPQPRSCSGPTHPAPVTAHSPLPLARPSQQRARPSGPRARARRPKGPRARVWEAPVAAQSLNLTAAVAPTLTLTSQTEPVTPTRILASSHTQPQLLNPAKTPKPHLRLVPHCKRSAAAARRRADERDTAGGARHRAGGGGARCSRHVGGGGGATPCHSAHGPRSGTVPPSGIPGRGRPAGAPRPVSAARHAAVPRAGGPPGGIGPGREGPTD